MTHATVLVPKKVEGSERISYLDAAMAEQGLGELIDELVKGTPGLMKMSQHREKPKTAIVKDCSGEAYGLISQFLDEFLRLLRKPLWINPYCSSERPDQGAAVRE